MIYRNLVAWWRSDRGSVAAEFSVVAPGLVMLLVFVAVVIHRGVDARIRVDDAAHQAVRAASIERTATAAASAAHATAADALADAGVACRSLDVRTSTGGPDLGDAIRVTVSCEVEYGDALLLGVPGSRRVSANAVEPVDTWRSDTLGFGIGDAPGTSTSGWGGL